MNNNKYHIDTSEKDIIVGVNIEYTYNYLKNNINKVYDDIFDAVNMAISEAELELLNRKGR